MKLSCQTEKTIGRLNKSIPIQGKSNGVKGMHVCANVFYCVWTLNKTIRKKHAHTHRLQSNGIHKINIASYMAELQVQRNHSRHSLCLNTFFMTVFNAFLLVCANQSKERVREIYVNCKERQEKNSIKRKLIGINSVNFWCCCFCRAYFFSFFALLWERRKNVVVCTLYTFDRSKLESLWVFIVMLIAKVCARACVQPQVHLHCSLCSLNYQLIVLQQFVSKAQKLHQIIVAWTSI